MKNAADYKSGLRWGSIAVAGYATCCIDESCVSDSGARMAGAAAADWDLGPRGDKRVNGAWCGEMLASFGE